MKILIIGYGVTGKAVAKYLKDEDYYIYDEDYQGENFYNYQKLKKELPLFELGIKSPGVRDEQALALIRILCKTIISELDFAFLKLPKCHLIGVTGSNGKTTLVTLMTKILKLKYDAYYAGNIGVPLISLVNKVKSDSYIVVELSSFQIEDMNLIKFERVYFTSLCPNHLDEYYNVRHYYAAKKRVRFFTNDLRSLDKIKTLNLNKVGLNDDEIKTNLIGNINKQYCKLCLNIAIEENIPYEDAKEVISSFINVKYRLNKEFKIKNFSFINDSKSTTMDSTKYAYSLFKNRKVILIIGGIHKSDSFKKIKLRKNDVVLIYGQDRYKIKKQIDGKTFKDLQEVIKYIRQIQEERLVLFSPGCSSFDQYTNYLERGKDFDDLVYKYIS